MKLLLPALFFFCVVVGSVNAQETWNFQWEGLVRSCLVDFPSSHSGQSGLPVVFNLHGYGSSAGEQRYFTQLQLLGDSVGFITVYPAAYSQRWNSGIGDNSLWPTPNVDDVGFIARIIDSLALRFAIDTERVYCCGFSNGGFMSLKLAARLSSRIAAVACVSGVLTNSIATGFSVKRPVPLLMIHGTGDLIIPFDGGEVGWYSVEETMRFWIAANNYSLGTDTLAVPDRDPYDQSTVVKYSYRSNGELRVELLKVVDGGHTWPGGFGLPTEFGPINMDIRANDEIWNFFKQSANRIDDVRSTDSKPATFFLSQNYPNPFNPSTAISYQLPAASKVRLVVYDLIGREVATLVDGNKPAGFHTVQFDATGLASGIYFYRLQARLSPKDVAGQAENSVETRTLLHLR